MSFRKPTSLFFTALCALQLLCTQSNTVVMTGGSEVVGKMVDKAGNPISGAIIRLDTTVNSSDTSFDSLTSVNTNPDGSFIIKRDHGGGTYSIYGNYKNQTLVILIRNIKDTVTDTLFHIVDIGTHIMVEPGFIKGRIIKYSAPDSMDGTTCYIPGTSFSATTDDSGKFVISGIAPETCSVYFSAPYYSPLHLKNIVVSSGKVTDIGTDSLSLDPNQPLGSPRSVRIAYDTVHGVVTVSWSKLPVSDLQGYVISRSLNSNGMTIVLDTVSILDTFFMDTLYRSFNDTIQRIVQYEVAGIDNADRGLFSQPVSAPIVAPYNVRTIFYFSPSDTFTAGDSIKVVVKFVNNQYLNKKISWFLQDTGNASLQTDAVSQKSGFDTLKTIFPHDGKVILLVKSVDERGMAWIDSSPVNVIPHAVDIIRCDSTTSGITLHWQKSNQSDFASYRLYKKNKPNDSLLFTFTSRSDTAKTISTYKNGNAQYYVVVVDSQNIVSKPGKICNAWIKNSPPIFVVDTTTLLTTLSVNSPLNVVLSAKDLNGDSVTFTKGTSVGSITAHLFSWIPTTNDTGTRKIIIYAIDSLGAKDSLVWTVRVTISGLCTYGDSMSTPRFSAAAAVVNDVLYVAGGTQYISQSGSMQPFSLSTVEKHSLPSNSAWTTMPALNSLRSDFGMVASGNQLIAVGGVQAVGQVKPAIFINSIDTISSTGSKWQTAFTMPASLAGSAVCSIGSKVYCIGGMINATTVSNKILEYDASTGTLNTITSLQSARAYSQAVVDSGKIYVIGGWGGSADFGQGNSLSSMEIFDPATKLVTIAADSLKTARYYFCAAVVNGKIYAIGGCTRTGSGISSIEEYDLQYKSWTVKAQLPEPRSYCAAVSYQNKVYIIGGIIGDVSKKMSTGSMVIYYP